MNRLPSRGCTDDSTLLGLLVIVVWLAGIVVAVAKTSTISVIIAITFPPYALYLVMEHALKLVGFI